MAAHVSQVILSPLLYLFHLVLQHSATKRGRFLISSLVDLGYR